MLCQRYSHYSVLLIDDEQTTLRIYQIALESAGLRNVLICHESQKALSLVAKENPQLIILDLNMPGVCGQDILEQVVAEYPQISIIVITGDQEIETAVRCMKAGAFDYLVKPVERNRLVSIVRKAIEIDGLRRENTLLKQRILDNSLANPEAFSEIVTNNSSMRAIFHYAESVADSLQPLLISGETGVGKELMARAVYGAGNRRGACVFVNVAGIDDNTFTDTLFGHLRGAFTGAEGIRAGLVEKAAGGTLVLDEIGDLDLRSQVKLLRLIQEREFYPLGSDTAKTSDARIIVCTNLDLTVEMEKGTFRKDLYYRLQAHKITLPALRQRKDDIELLLEHFVSEASSELKRRKPSLPRQLLNLLSQYHFPGNIRELRAMVYDAVSTASSRTLSLESFHSHIEHHRSRCSSYGEEDQEIIDKNGLLPLSGSLPTLKEANSWLIREALRRTKNNQSMAARMLGISRQTLARNMQMKNK